MVKIAIAGGSGKIAREIMDVLVATRKHQIIILSRQDPAAVEERPNVSWAKVDYLDKTQLIKILRGVHTVLCFSGAHLDPGSIAQKSLIDAAIIAGVKQCRADRTVVSKSSSVEELPWYAEKANVRAYMKEINKEKKPGLLLEFLAPVGSAKHVQPQELWIDFIKRRAIILTDKDPIFTVTSVRDLAHVVARAIEYEGEWPVLGGVHGTTLSTSKLLEIGARVQAMGYHPFPEEEVRSDNFDPPWVPIFKDPYLTTEQMKSFSKVILKGSILSSACGSWIVSDEWNRLLPNYKFAEAEEYLEKVWADKA
ncbi:hypothetical protein D0Z07_6442 [Hyphodiscus hymeniophilus]|uniref:NmrA-like domain-containing protein n=1 Tax=Hyphodiscus hymeniophilus TaxID=353542 RepID=A0A9P6VFC6_9HELO|nr:hypothetical protein D0Z07_6442 [Hyphodiscus hymeniophilus]